MLWTLNMYMLDQIIARKLMDQPNTETDKNLRDQASPIAKNKDVMDTEYVHVRSNNSSQVNGPIEYRNNCFETANNSNSGSNEE